MTQTNEVTITIRVGNGRSVVKTLTETEAVTLGLVESKPKVWNPFESGVGFHPAEISSFRIAKYGNNHELAKRNANMGLYHETKEESEKQYEYLCAIKRIKDYCFENFEEVVNERKIRKYAYFVSFEYGKRKFIPNGWDYGSFAQAIPFVNSETECRQLIEDCEKDLKIVFGIN